MTTFDHVTTEEKVAAYEASSKVFHGLLKEMRELSKKKADATLSKGKVTILNRVLEDLREFLSDEPEAKYLDPLDDEDLPQNSDAVLVMVQYESALSAFKNRYRKFYLGETSWITESILNEIESYDYDETD